MRATLATLAIVLASAPAMAQVPAGMRMNGVDPEARRILASDEPVGFAARCVADLVRRSWRSATLEERSGFEEGAERLTRAMPDIARATGVRPARAEAALALATMPLVTFSIGLVPGKAPGADAGPTDACVAAGRDPGAYVTGLAPR